MANRDGSSDGGATTTAPSSWNNASLAGIFKKKYTKDIDTYWPYNSTTSTKQHDKGGGFPGWAGAIIGVVLGLLLIAFLVGFLLYRRRRRQRQAKEAESEKEKEKGKANPSPSGLTYGSGPSSPGPGPVSTSTGDGTADTSRTQPSTVQPSEGQTSVAQSSATHPSTVQDPIPSQMPPARVESGGDEVYEMHGTTALSSNSSLNDHFTAEY